jgi:exodeoxyribonuclease VII small subunit
MSEGAPKTFEAKLDRIDEIVKELENGRPDLDRAIVLFKEGKTLARECETLLRDAQAQIDGAMSEPPERDGEPQVPF